MRTVRKRLSTDSHGNSCLRRTWILSKRSMDSLTLCNVELMLSGNRFALSRRFELSIQCTAEESNVQTLPRTNPDPEPVAEEARFVNRELTLRPISHES